MMLRCSRWFACLSISLVLLSADSGGQTGQFSLKAGDNLPQLAGQALNGKWVDVGKDSGGSPAVVVYAFSRAGGRDAQLWSDRLMKDDPHLSIYTIIFLESVPGMFRGLAVSGIKSGMPAALQGRTIILYRDEDVWKQRLRVANERNASVTLLGATGRVEWMTAGPFADTLYSEFSKSLRGLK